jgi:hypothetical protein
MHRAEEIIEELDIAIMAALAVGSAWLFPKAAKMMVFLNF